MNKINQQSDKSMNLSIQDLLDKKYEIFSSQIRLSVMLILHSYQKVKIAELQKSLNISSGKLEHHLNTLETISLIRKKPALFSKRVLTIIEMTEKGESLLLEYLEIIRETLKNLGSELKEKK